MDPRKRKPCLDAAWKLFLFSQGILFGSAINLNLRDAAPCQFWNGSVYFDDVCYKVVHSSTWHDGLNACKDDHRQAQMAELTSMRSVYFLSLYSTYMEKKHPDHLYWLAATLQDREGPRWLTLKDNTLLPVAQTRAFTGTACLVMDTRKLTLNWTSCTDQGINTLCKVDVPLNFCPFPSATYHNGSCYALELGPLNYNKAQKKCKGYEDLIKGYLVEIDSEDEFNFLALFVDMFMYESNITTVYVGAYRNSKSGQLLWLRSKLQVNTSRADWWHQEELAPNGLDAAGDCLVLSRKSGLTPLFETVDCMDTAALVCEIGKGEERYIVSVPMLKLDTDDLPEATLIISALNKLFQYHFMLVTYREVNGSRVSTMLTDVIGNDTVFYHELFDMGDFVSGTNVQTSAVVVSSDKSFVVTLVYKYPGRNDKLFTSSVLSPLGLASELYFIVTSTTICSEIPVVGNSTEVNPIVSNINCACETFILVVAVGADGNTKVRFEFPLNTKLKFNAGGLEVQDPKTMTVELQIYESAFIKSESDFSGTFIEATQYIIVFTGFTVKKITDSSVCTTSLTFTQAKPVTEGDIIHHTAPFELAPPDGITSLENYRVIALADHTDVTLTSGQGEEFGKIVLNRAGEIREFSIPNTELYIIKSSLPVIVYRLSFAAPNENTNVNDVISPCLVRAFSNRHSLKNKVEHVFPRTGVDYIHVVVRSLGRKSTRLEGLSINGQLYNKSPYNSKEFYNPVVTAVRLDVSGLERIRISKVLNGITAPSSRYSGHACIGRVGGSGYCTDLESRHNTKTRLFSKVGTKALVNKRFHESPGPVVQYGLDSTAHEETNSSSSPTTDSLQNESETESPTASSADFLEISVGILNSTHHICPIRMFTLKVIRERVLQFREEIRQRLFVNKREMSAFVRSKTSAEDPRPSSQTIGAVALGFLCLAGILVVLPDFIAVFHWLANRHAQ